MTYKQTLFFVARCLTIQQEEKNRILIENKLKSNTVDWDAVVKLSTAHYVFPALYCNLKRANLLEYVPDDLVEYMIHITNLNRERNEQIIEQAKEVNQLLLDHNITPVFLKGTGNLLEGLYEDIAERMVGDIDFIFSKKEYPKAIKILTSHKYSNVIKSNYHFPSFKHYPRLKKENSIAAVEIHKEILIEKYRNEFNYDFINKDCLKTNNISVMSYKNQLSLSIIAKQINDDGFYYKNIMLRNAYDVYLLSKKTIAKDAFSKFNTLKNPLNCFLASCFEVFNKPNSLKYTSTKKIETYLARFNELLKNDELRNKQNKKIDQKIFIKKRLDIIYKSFFNKPYRGWLLKRITDKNWQKEKLIQLGFIKQKRTL